MPADFLKRATAAHLRANLRTFGEAEVKDGGRYVWFAEEADGEEYTVAVPCSIQVPKRRKESVSGELEAAMESDVVIHLDRDALPFVPDPENDVLFLIATADGGAPSEDDQKKYLLVSISDPLPGTTAVRLTANLHV